MGHLQPMRDSWDEVGKGVADSPGYMVVVGETRHYPDAEGPVYEALEDTAYSPDVYPQHWKKVEGEEEA